MLLQEMVEWKLIAPRFKKLSDKSEKQCVGGGNHICRG